MSINTSIRARKGASNVHRRIDQTGGDARGDWNNALEKASNDFATQQLAQIAPLYANAPDLSPEVKQMTHDWIYLGAKDYAWKQLEQKYPEPSKFQNFLGEFSKIPILNSIPAVQFLTGVAGVGSNLLHF